MPTATSQSIVDTLKKKGLPSDATFRASLYENLGLGTKDKFLAGIVSGSTNVELLDRFNKNPELLDTIAASYNSGGSLGDINSEELAKTNAVDQKQQGNTFAGASSPTSGSGLPADIQSINDFQKSYVERFNTSQDKANALIGALETAKPRTLAEILQQESDLKSALGIGALEEQYGNLATTIKGIENDVRTEVAGTGGIVTESQIKDMAYERTKKLNPELERLETSLSSKYAMAEIIRKNLGTEREESADRAEQLLTLYQGEADKALNALMDFYQEDQETVRQGLSEARNERSKILELSLKYPSSGINASSDTLAGAYQKAASYAAVHGTPGDDSELKKRAQYAAARQLLTDNPDASFRELRAAILENTALNSTEVDALLSGEGYRSDALDTLSEDQTMEMAIGIVKSLGDVASAKSFLDSGSTIPLESSDGKTKEVYLSPSLRNSIKAAMDEAYPSGKRDWWDTILPGGK